MENRRSSNAEKGSHFREHEHKSARRHLSDTNTSLPRTQNHSHSSRQAESLPALGGEDSYIRQWLAQTDQQNNASIKKSRTELENFETQETFQRPKHSLQAFKSVAGELPDAYARPRKRRRHNSSSDSSLLEVTVQPKLSEQRLERAAQLPSVSPKIQKKRKLVASDAGSLSQRGSHRETFEKRARYKTREDLYESKEKKEKKKRESDIGEDRKPKAKRVKKGDGKKAAKKAGEDLMSNFTSKSVGHNRLTIRPSQGLGLFKNGRASSPAKRRGLPDLAFSEMDFLQRSSYPASKIEDKITSRSREKEARKVGRAHDEVSTFFKRTKTPLHEISPNRQRRDSSRKNVPMARLHSQSRSLDFSDEQCSRRDRAGPSIHKPSTPGRISASRTRSGGDHDAETRYSGKAATYISWSETQFSPHGTPESGGIENIHGQMSPVPESVRLSIENTGIFEGTGISLSPDKRRSRSNGHPSPFESKRSPTIPRAATESSSRKSPTTKNSKNISTIALERSPDDLTFAKRIHSPGKLRINHEVERRASTTQPYSKSHIGNLQARSSTARPHEGSIEHCDQEHGWHQRQPSRLPKSCEHALPAKASGIEEPRSTPIDRNLVAQKARIKRPSTALPVTSTASERDSVDKHTRSELPTNDVSDNFTSQAETAPPGKQDTTSNNLHTDQEPQSELAPNNSLPQREFIHPGIKSGSIATPTEDGELQNRQAGWHSINSLPTRNDTRLNEPQERALDLNFERGDQDLTRPQSWIGQNRGFTVPRSRLSSIMEVTPLYVHQMERNLVDHPDISQGFYQAENEQMIIEEYLGESEPIVQPYWEEVGDVAVTGELGNDYGLQDRYSLQYEEQQFGDYSAEVSGSLSMLQSPEYIATAEIENCDLHQDIEHRVHYTYETEDEFSRFNVAPSYGYEENCQQPDSMEGVYTRRFWAPNRQY